MEWVLEHIRIILLVGGAIVYWLAQRKKAKEDAEIKEVLSTPDPREEMHEDVERTRRIQEEIRRKILERAGGATRQQQPQQAEAAPMRPTPPPLPREQPQEDVYNRPTAEEEQLAADQAMLERQQQLADKLRELQQQRRDIERPAEAFAEKTAKAMSASGTSVIGSPLADLRNPTAVRRAIVLREVLGPPVALR